MDSWMEREEDPCKIRMYYPEQWSEEMKYEKKKRNGQNTTDTYHKICHFRYIIWVFQRNGNTFFPTTDVAGVHIDGRQHDASSCNGQENSYHGMWSPSRVTGLPVISGIKKISISTACFINLL